MKLLFASYQEIVLEHNISTKETLLNCWSFCKSVWPSFAKSLKWTLLTIFFGLLQIVFVYVISLIMKDKPFSMEYFLNNCTLLFFSTAVIASITIDSLINKRISNVTLNALFPLVIISICSVLYTCYYLNMVSNNKESLLCDCLNTEIINLKNFQTLQYEIFFLAIVFTIGCKTIENYVSNLKD